MARVTVAAGISCVLAVSMAAGTAAVAQSADRQHEMSDRWMIGYGHTFALDLCGKPSLGQRLRAATLKRVDACEFSASSKMNFRRFASEADMREVAEIENLRRRFGDLPANLPAQMRDDLCGPSDDEARARRRELEGRLQRFEAGDHDALGTCQAVMPSERGPGNK